MATQIDESRLRKKTLLNLICCTLNLRKVYYTLNIQCSTHAQNCRSAAKYSSTIQCGVHSFAEWPGVTINQGGKSRPAEKRSLAIWQEDILLLPLPFDIKYQAISSWLPSHFKEDYVYPPHTTILWHQVWDHIHLFTDLWYQAYEYTPLLPLPFETNISLSNTLYLYLYLYSSSSNGCRYLILLGGSWYAAHPTPQLSKHYSLARSLLYPTILADIPYFAHSDYSTILCIQ